MLLDNAGGSQILGGVIDEIGDYLRTCNVQHGASYRISREAVARVDAGKRAIATLFGTGPGTVVIGSSTTQLVFNLAAALAPSLQPGDEIIVTEADHEANIGAWRRLTRYGVVVRTWPLDRERLRLELADLQPLLSSRTRLVCMTHCSNVLGTIHDVQAVAQVVHAAGARLFVDGVALAPHAPVDAATLGVDGYVMSLYKVYGPHLAAMYLSPEFFAELATINHHFLADAGAYRLEPGGVNYELVASCVAISSYLDELGWTVIAQHEEQLSHRLLNFLTAHRRVRVIGETTSDRTVRVPTISFVVDGMTPDQVPAYLDRRGFAVRWGDFYARGLMDALALPTGVVRVSMVHYNTLDEVDRLITALAPLVA